MSGNFEGCLDIILAFLDLVAATVGTNLCPKPTVYRALLMIALRDTEMLAPGEAPDVFLEST
jgi:hypothetical protein